MPEPRAKLDLGDLDDEDRAARPKPDASLIREAAEQAGFQTSTPKPSAKKPRASKPAAGRAEPPASRPVRRRTRPKTGRIHHFGTRLTEKTLQAIYDYAETNDLLIAEVLERAMAALVEADKKGQGTP